MKKITAMICIIFSGLTLYAQISYKTGSTELDTDVNKINVEANKDYKKFSADMSLSYNVSTKKIDLMKTTYKMSAGDIYLSLELSKIAKKPIDEVLEVYSVNKDKGWGYIAKQMGIKPGSPEFHQLKGNAKNKNANKGNSGKGNSGKGNSGKSSSGSSKSGSGKSSGSTKSGSTKSGSSSSSGSGSTKGKSKTIEYNKKK